MNKQILITIPKNGPTKIEAFGYAGVGCKARVDQLGAALGDTISEEDKPEYYECEETEKAAENA